MDNSDFQKLLGIMKDIPYLIKFQKDATFAETLLKKGEIFLQSAQYYAELEMKTGIRGQGDRHEAQYFGFINMGMEFPIYCMYAVNSSQLKNQEIIIDPRVVDDFCKDGGYITICKTTDFLHQFNQFCETDDWCAGRVWYVNRTPEFDIECLKRKITPHFFKDVDLAYQQEFRIKINESLEKVVLPEKEQIIPVKNGKPHWREHRFTPRTEYIGDISSFSIQFTLKDLYFNNGKYFLKLPF